MSAIHSLLHLIGRPFAALDTLMNSDFKLRWKGRRLRVVAEPIARESRPRATTTGKPSVPASDLTVTMQAELRELINQHEKTRELMRHLAYIERSLRLGGSQALDEVPLPVLAKGYTQLKCLVPDWSSPGLSELRSRLAVTIAAKEAEATRKEPANSGLSAFFTTTRIQVSEGTASDFQAAQQTWAK